jgi:uncharacterized protein YprB with RNaseH-like and TPR domain
LGDDILVWDVETTPNIGCFWRAGRKITILPAAILQERQMCVVGYRWLGAKKSHSFTWGPDRDEEGLVRRAVALLDRARFSIAHNGDRFDVPWLRGRAMYYRIPMDSYYATVDTLKAFQRLANLNSHRLDYLGEYFGLGRKIKTGFELWKRIVTENHQPSLRSMATYCRGDVDLLMNIYLEFRSYFPAPPVRISRNVSYCPYCDGSSTVVWQHTITKAGSPRLRLKCRDCDQTYTVAASRYEREQNVDAD